MPPFTPSDIFEFAIRIEENGRDFYLNQAEKTDNEGIRELFTTFAEDEKEHKETFSKMLATIESYDPPEAFPDEYFLYLRSYADSQIFQEEKQRRELESIHNAGATVSFALQREFDSILFYQEIKPTIPPEKQYLIDTIIAEERRHVIRLNDIRKTL